MKLLSEILRTPGGYQKKERQLWPIHDKLVNHYDYSNLDKKSFQHLTNYTSDGSGEVNDHLWAKHHAKKPNIVNKVSSGWGSAVADKVEDQHNDRMSEKIPHLDAALNHVKTPQKLTVWSGTRDDPREHANEHGVVHHPAYLSTSLNQVQSENFAQSHQKLGEKGVDVHRHVLKIGVPKGHSGAYVDHISANMGEKEFILPRGTNLKLNRHTEQKQYSEATKRNYIFHIHHATIQDNIKNDGSESIL